MPVVEVPELGNVEFPDEMSPAMMSAHIQNHLGSLPNPARATLNPVPRQTSALQGAIPADAEIRASTLGDSVRGWVDKAKAAAEPLINATSQVFRSANIPAAPIVQRPGETPLDFNRRRAIEENSNLVMGMASHIQGEPAPISFVKDRFAGPEWTMIRVNTAALDQAWAKDAGYYIPPGGGGAEIGGRRAGFEDFLQKGQSIEAPRIHLDENGAASFENGRHRFSVLRDAGYDRVNVLVDGDHAERIQSAIGGMSSASTPDVTSSTLFTGGPEGKFKRFDLSNAGKANGLWEGYGAPYGSDTQSVAQKYADYLENGVVRQFDLPNRHLPNFLDWNRPVSAQTAEVKAALDKLYPEGIINHAGVTGEQIYNELADRWRPGAVVPGTNYVPPGTVRKLGAGYEYASKLLESIGIRGNTYADQLLRGARNYVTFNPSILGDAKIVK